MNKVYEEEQNTQELSNCPTSTNLPSFDIWPHWGWGNRRISCVYLISAFCPFSNPDTSQNSKDDALLVPHWKKGKGAMSIDIIEVDGGQAIPFMPGPRAALNVIRSVTFSGIIMNTYTSFCRFRKIHNFMWGLRSISNIV